MKKFCVLALTICLIASNVFTCFADSSQELSLEKQAVLSQVEDAVLNDDGSVTIPIESGESICVDLGNGYKTEYSAAIPMTRATTKNVSATVKHSFLTAEMRITYSANCTWGSPSRCVTMNSLTAYHNGTMAEFNRFNYGIVTRTSEPGGYATGMGTGEIVFGPNNQILTQTHGFYHNISVDSADSSKLYVTIV